MIVNDNFEPQEDTFKDNFNELYKAWLHMRLSTLLFFLIYDRHFL